MRIWINDKWETLPSSLHEITIKQRADFQNLHGKELELMAKSISEIEDELERELEITLFQFEKMFRTVSFFLNCSVDSLKQSGKVDEIASAYFSCLDQIFKDEEELELQNEFVWNNEMWYLSSPELKHGDKLAFAELIDSKQMIQNMIGVGKNKWECLIPLAAIFLRKKDEEYSEEFLYEGSDRLEQMKNLPLSIAIHVGFFLNSSLNMFINTSQSFIRQELKEQEKI